MGARVVGETRRPVLTAPPPRTEGELPWREAPVPAGDGPPMEHAPPLFILEGVARAIDAHVRDRARQGEEALGLLVGDWALDGAGAPYTVASDAPTGLLAGTAVSVRFKPEGLAQVARDLDRRHRAQGDMLVVGWYHSHLDIGCFMSDVDLRTQRTGFPHAHQHALVVDPAQGTAAAFANGPAGPGTVRARLLPSLAWKRPPRGI
jgi:proteasome lid subunit RPN8/RPN11